MATTLPPSRDGILARLGALEHAVRESTAHPSLAAEQAVVAARRSCIAFLATVLRTTDTDFEREALATYGAPRAVA